MELSDEQLMKAYQDGDEAAIETLIRRYAGYLLGYLTKMTRNRTLAEDLFQETFFRIHKKADTYQGKGSFKSWMMSIATRAAIDAMRKNKRRPITVSMDAQSDDTSPLTAFLPDDQPTPAEITSHSDQRHAVRLAIERLPDQQRSIVTLAYFEDMKYRHIAEILNCSVGTVKKQMARAVKSLARLLPRETYLMQKGGAL